MNHLTRVMLASALACAALPAPRAMAGTFTDRIGQVLIYEGGPLVYVYPVNGVVNPPSCHGSNGNYTSFSMTRPRAREYLAGLLAAQMGGKTVTFITYGACIDQPMSDTLAYFVINS